jgi:hypothetical protein
MMPYTTKQVRKIDLSQCAVERCGQHQTTEISGITLDFNQDSVADISVTNGVVNERAGMRWSERGWLVGRGKRAA